MRSSWSAPGVIERWGCQARSWERAAVVCMVYVVCFFSAWILVRTLSWAHNASRGTRCAAAQRRESERVERCEWAGRAVGRAGRAARDAMDTYVALVPIGAVGFVVRVL